MDLTVLLVSTVVLFLFTLIPPKNEMNRSNGLIYLLMYAGYLMMLFNV